MKSVWTPQKTSKCRMAVRAKIFHQQVRSTWWFREATWRRSSKASSEDIFWWVTQDREFCVMQGLQQWQSPMNNLKKKRKENTENHFVIRGTGHLEMKKGGKKSKTKNTFVIHSVSVDQICFRCNELILLFAFYLILPWIKCDLRWLGNYKAFLSQGVVNLLTQQLHNK